MRWLAVLFLVAFRCAWADSLSGTVVIVFDGDSLVVQDASKKRYRVRLAGIDAPERGQPFYVESARSLADVCYRKEAKVEWSEQDRWKRYVGSVTCAGKDAAAEQLKRGMAWGSPKATAPTSPLYELEAYARLRKLGLWSDEKPVPPWEWAKKR